MAVTLLACLRTTAQETEKLTLKQAVEYALKSKADALKAQIGVQKAEEEITDARANALPKISATAAITYNIKLQEMVMAGGFPGMPGPMRIKMGQDWNAMAGVSLQQALFNQQVFTGLKAAKTTRDFYILNQELTKEQVVEKVANAYYRVFQAKQALENIEQNINLTNKSKEVVRGLHDVGLAKKIDLDRMEVATTNLESAKQQVANAYELSKNALKFMMGMEMDKEIDLEENTFEITPLDTQSKEGERTEVKVLEKQKELLSLASDAQKASLYPSLYLVGNYTYLGLANKMPLFKGEKDQVYWSDFSSVGLNLSVPIFSGLGNKAKIRKAKLEVESLELNIKDAKLAMDLEFKNAKNSLKNSLITIESQQKNVKLAQEVLENTQNNYRQGLASLTDLLSAEKELTDAKNNYTNALLEYKIAEIALLKAQGKLMSLAQ